MKQDKKNLQKAKISPAFEVRLNRLDPQQEVRAIVLLRIHDSREASSKSRSHGRQEKIEAIRKSAKEALNDVYGILKRHGGECLAESPDALGSIPIETTVAGIKELATSEHVKAILEDQPISALYKPKDERN
ncbi:MAG: hypothetical protein ACE5JP_03265 [Candidatus Bipolaricaulia bacterium]